MTLTPKKPSVQQLVDMMPEPFVIIDKNYKIVAANQKYCQNYDTNPQQIAGKCCHEVSHHSDVPCHQNGEHCPLIEVFSSRQPASVVHVHYDRYGNEERVQLNALPILDGDGKVSFMGEKINSLDAATVEEDILVGRSGSMLRFLSILQRVAPTNTTVLLEGESGTGKECAAQYLHRYSEMHRGSLVVVDCASLDEGSLERELFGEDCGEQGEKPGLLDVAHLGTVYLDEVCELSPLMQNRLLRFIETSSFRRSGGSEYRSIATRLVASSSRALSVMVERGQFRQDLYYRLSAFPVTIPPLRDRKDDIPLLAEALLNRIPRGSSYLPLGIEVIEVLMRYDFPGNVRELRNILQRATILAGDRVIDVEHLRFEGLSVNRDAPGLECSHEVAQLTDKQERILTALRNNGGNRGKAARALGMSERTIYRHVRTLRASLGDSYPGLK